MYIPQCLIPPDALIMSDVKSQNSRRKGDDGCQYGLPFIGDSWDHRCSR